MSVIHPPIRFFILTTLLITVFVSAFGSKTLILSDPEENYVFRGEYFDVFFDKYNSYSIEEISSPSFALFKDNQWDVPHFATGFNSSFWIRFKVENHSVNEHQWFIELFDFKIDKFEIYIPDGKGGFQVKEGGDIFPFHNRPVSHKNFIYPIPTPSKESRNFFIRFQSRKPIAVFGAIRRAEKLLSYSNLEYYFLALFYGIALAMILYNIFLFITINDQTYLYYVLYIFSISIYSLTRDGTGFQFLWPQRPALNYYLGDISLFSLTIWALMYGKSFLNTAALLPLHNKMILRVILLRGLIFLIDIFDVISPAYNLIYIDMACFAYLYVLGILSLSNGFKAARYYVGAFTVFFAGFYITSLEDLGILSNKLWTVYAINAGLVAEMLLLSIALADRVKELLKDKEEVQVHMIEQLKVNQQLKDQLNVELEKKVDERTREIHHMLLELESKNLELSGANAQLKQLHDKVKVMNRVLEMDNERLSIDLLEVSKSRVLLEDVKLDEFQKVFPNEEACLKYLAEQKWKHGFRCRKCDYTKTTRSKFLYGMRCRNCNYDESATNDTLFHNLKFPITKAFYMIYLVSVKDKKIGLQELSEILDLRKETCWRFRKKIMLAKENRRKEEKQEMDGWGAIAMISLKEAKE